MQQWLLTTTLLRRSKLVFVLRELCIERHLLISSAFAVTSVTWDIKASEIISTRRGWTQSSDGTGNTSVERDGHHSLWQTLASFARGLGGDLVTTGARHLLARRRGLALIFGETPTKHIHNLRTSTSMMGV